MIVKSERVELGISGLMRILLVRKKNACVIPSNFIGTHLPWWMLAAKYTPRHWRRLNDN